MHRWNPKNIPGILDLYARDGPEGCRFCRKSKPATGLEALAIMREEYALASTAESMNCPEKLTTAYPGVERTRETLDLYIEMLADIPGYVLMRAVEEYLVKANWFPKISELRQAAAKVAGSCRNRR